MSYNYKVMYNCECLYMHVDVSYIYMCTYIWYAVKQIITPKMLTSDEVEL